MLAWSCIQLMTRNILMCHTFTPMPKKLFVSCLHFHRLISLCDMFWIRKSCCSTGMLYDFGPSTSNTSTQDLYPRSVCSHRIDFVALINTEHHSSPGSGSTRNGHKDSCCCKCDTHRPSMQPRNGYRLNIRERRRGDWHDHHSTCGGDLRTSTCCMMTVTVMIAGDPPFHAARFFSVEAPAGRERASVPMWSTRVTMPPVTPSSLPPG